MSFITTSRFDHPDTVISDDDIFMELIGSVMIGAVMAVIRKAIIRVKPELADTEITVDTSFDSLGIRKNDLHTVLAVIIVLAAKRGLRDKQNGTVPIGFHPHYVRDAFPLVHGLLGHRH